MGIILHLCIALTFPFLLKQELPPADVIFDQINLENGLSNNNVLCLLKDHKGFIWFGTEDGLNRYDGYDFEIFRYSPSDPGSISNSYIFSMLEDSRQNLWVGTHYGLNLFIRSKGNFLRIIFPEIDSTIAHDGFIHAMVEGPDGGIWVGTHTGLYRVDAQSYRFEHFLINPVNPDIGNAVLSLAPIGGNHLLVGTEKRGLLRFNITTGQFEEYWGFSSQAIRQSHVYTLLVDSSSRVWVGLRGMGLSVLSSDGKLLHTFTKQNGLVNDHVYAIAQSEGGYFWIGTDDGYSIINQCRLVKESAFIA